MGPNENNEAAWWVAGIVGFGVFVWKAIWNMRKDTLDDKDARHRQDLIRDLRDEIDRLSELVTALDAANSRLSMEIDTEKERRRTAEEFTFGCRQREKHLERVIVQLEAKLAKR